MAIQNDQINAVESTTLTVSAANGVLANDSGANGPLMIADDFILKRTAGGGQIKFAADGSYYYVSAPGFSGVDTVQYTALDANSDVVGTGTLTINVAPAAQVPFVSVGQLSQSHLVTSGFPQVGNGVATSAFTPVPLSGGGYVVVVVYQDIALGQKIDVRTYDANHNLVSVFDPGFFAAGSRVVALPNGGHALAYGVRDPNTFGETNYVQLFDAAGHSLSGPTPFDVPEGRDRVAGFSALPNGGFVLLQTSTDNAFVSQLYARSFDANGVPESQPFAIGTTDDRLERILPNGEIVVSQIAGSNFDELHIRRFDLHGNPIGAEIVTPSDSHPIASGGRVVTAMPGGGFAVSWMTLLAPQQHPQPLNQAGHILLVDADGNPGTEITIPARDFGTLFGVPLLTLTPLANGGFVVNSRAVLVNGEYVEAILVFDANGNAVGSPIDIDAQGSFGTTRALVYALPAGGFVISLQSADPANHNLLVYDNNGGAVGEIRMHDAGDGTGAGSILLANLPNGTLILSQAYSAAADLITTRTIHFDTPTPVVQNGVILDASGIVPVAVSIFDPDGSEFVHSFDVTGVPGGWTLTAPTASAVLHNGIWTITGADIAYGGKLDLVLTPNAPVNTSLTINVVAHTIELDNGTQNQSLPAPFALAIQTGPVTTGTSGDDSYSAPGGRSLIDAGLGTDTVTLGFKLTEAAVTFSGNQVIVDGPSGSHTVLTGIEKFVFTDGTVDNTDGNRLVDDLFYYSQNHDVWNAHVDADAHYSQYGWHENRDPSAFFDTSLYLALNPDVRAAGVNPLTHFDQWGWKEGRISSLGFDPAAYLAANPDVKAAGVDPLLHFLHFGAQEGRQPIAFTELFAANGFDYVYYLNKNPDVAAANVDPLQHFQQYGWKEGRNPNAFFDTKGYFATYTDVKAAGANPLDHYHLFGANEGRDPSVVFDSSSYLAANPDVMAANIDPLQHYLDHGRHEGRALFADGVWG